MQESIEIFISYAPKDYRFLQELVTHLAPLEQQGLITVWHDRLIKAGADREREIDEHLNRGRQKISST